MERVCARCICGGKTPKSEKCIFRTEGFSTRLVIFLKFSFLCSQVLPFMCCCASFTDRCCLYFEKPYYELFTLSEEREDLGGDTRAWPLPVPEQVWK